MQRANLSVFEFGFDAFINCRVTLRPQKLFAGRERLPRRTSNGVVPTFPRLPPGPSKRLKCSQEVATTVNLGVSSPEATARLVEPQFQWLLG